jgi:hypothetical protein
VVAAWEKDIDKQRAHQVLDGAIPVILDETREPAVAAPAAA